MFSLTLLRAGMVETAAEWHWSSYRSMIGEAPVPAWLAVDRLLGQFGDARETAQRHYRSFVDATGAYSYREIAKQFGVHLSTIGRIVRKEMLR